MIVAINTSTERSLLLIMPIIPVKNEDIPAMAAISIGTDNKRLLKNVAPPRCPAATRIWNIINNTIKVTMSHVDHLPKRVLGIK